MFKIDLDFKSKYIVSVSGGVDSMVLLDLLFEHGYDIVVVHFDHKVRKESELDYNLIKTYTTKNKLPFHFIELQIPPNNFQENARNLRHHHLQTIAKKYKTNYIITAHHLNDLAETILMNISTGSSLSGYSGFKEITNINGFIYLKPLLSISKEELYAYARSNDLSFLEDKTNTTSHYLRNRIRNKVITELSLEPNFLKNILTYSKILTTASSFIRNQTIDFLNNLPLNLKTFLSLDIAIQEDIILFLLEKNKLNKSYNLISQIILSLKNNKKPNITIKLSNDFCFIKEYNYFKITHEQPLIRTTPKIKIITPLKNEKNLTFLCYNNLNYPLKVRNRKNGDKLSFSFGTKKLKDFLIDKKIPRSLRDTLWIITDNNDNILWIPNLYLNQTLGNENKISLLLED